MRTHFGTWTITSTEDISMMSRTSLGDGRLWTFEALFIKVLTHFLNTKDVHEKDSYIESFNFYFIFSKTLSSLYVKV